VVVRVESSRSTGVAQQHKKGEADVLSTSPSSRTVERTFQAPGLCASLRDGRSAFAPGGGVAVARIGYVQGVSRTEKAVNLRNPRRASETGTPTCWSSAASTSCSPSAAYCTCPSGYACTQVVPEVQAGDPRAGAYCIQSGTAYNPNTVCSTCDPNTNKCP
jgi:hypothetical protein